MRNLTTSPARISGIGVWQWGLMGALVMLLLGVLLMVVFFAGVARYFAGPMGAQAAARSLGYMIGMLIACPIGGFVGGVIGALIYNLAGVTVGGLEIETSG